MTAWNAIRGIVGSAVDWIVQRMQPMLAVGGLAASAAGLIGFGPQAASAGPQAPGAPLPRGKAQPKVPASSARASATGKAAGDSHVYHITQQPGESGESLAKRIEAERRRREGVATRGSWEIAKAQ